MNFYVHSNSGFNYYRIKIPLNEPKTARCAYKRKSGVHLMSLCKSDRNYIREQLRNGAVQSKFVYTTPEADLTAESDTLEYGKYS